MEKVNLKRTSHSAVADAFQIFSDKLFASDRGQFFTPKIVVGMIVKMLSPKPADKIIDPACGVGGFLTGSYDYLCKKYPKASNVKKNLYAIDKEKD